MKTNEQIAVYMTDEEAKQFLLYQKYHDIFEKLTEVHAFDLQFGKITMNFAFGELQNIVREEMVYKR